MQNQRNVIAAFDSRAQANQAIQMLTQAQLSGLSLRVLPPPSAHTSYNDRVILSLMIEPGQAHRAEEIMGRFGHVDLVDQHRDPDRFDQHALQERNWTSQGVQADRNRQWRTQPWRRSQRGGTSGLRLPAMPDLGGTMMAALTAVGAGLALMYGMRKWAESESPRGARYGSRSRTPPSGAQNDPDGAGGYGVRASQGFDNDGDLGSGRQRLRDWREHGAMEGVDDRAGMSQSQSQRQPGDSGLAARYGLDRSQVGQSDETFFTTRAGGAPASGQVGGGSDAAIPQGLQDAGVRSPGAAGDPTVRGVDDAPGRHPAH